MEFFSTALGSVAAAEYFSPAPDKLSPVPVTAGILLPATSLWEPTIS